MFRRSLALALTTLALAGCAAEPDRRTGSPSSEGPDEPDASERPAQVESAGPEARLAVTYDGGVLVLRAEDGEVLADLPTEGYTRVHPAGDGRHVVVAAAGGFAALDLGAWTESHGDHGHSWTTDPGFTGVEVDAVEPGHVVAHAGRTVLFDDGTGEITSFRAADLEDGEPEVERHRTEEPHHGVAADLVSGDRLQTVGDEETRSGIVVLDREGREVAASDACPGVHGEAFARDVAVVGCEDGVLVVDGREIRKVQSPDGYGRIGNQAGSETSPFVLGDYKTDADAELERPERVSLVDTRDASLRLVDLGTSYSFRSLGRGPDGEGVVLGTDGALHVVDPRRGRVTDRLPVVDAWTEPTEWQQPRPTLHTVDGTAYVTDPAERALHVVDLETLEVTATHALPEVPDELAATTG